MTDIAFMAIGFAGAFFVAALSFYIFSRRTFR